MPDNTKTTPILPPVQPPADAPAATSDTNTPMSASTASDSSASSSTPSTDSVAPANDTSIPNGGSIMSVVASKIIDAQNILLALSSNPSVDELSAAIGLSLSLDRAGKRATAIYSGITPNALEFLKPEDTFETSTDTLQDFVIALSKDKADHLRYKLDGDYVRIFITPYKSRIAEEDLEFSYGDYNIDLVLALDVKSSTDLDNALREHGRIMHDATVINITNSEPGDFGEIEWTNPEASSVSEMSARLIYSMSNVVKVEKDDATAYLTGIVAATDRFSNDRTTSDAMQIAARLMASGADQKLISENIDLPGHSATKSSDDKPLNVSHGKKNLGPLPEIDVEEDTEQTIEIDNTSEDINGGSTASEGDTTEPTSSELASASAGEEDSTLPGATDDSAPSSDGLAATSGTSGSFDAPSIAPEPSSISAEPAPEPSSEAGALDDLNAAAASLTEAMGGASASTPSTGFIADKPETIVAPSADFSMNPVTDDKFGKMLETALDTAEPTPTIPDGGIMSNPALMNTPAVASAPEINGVPEINYMPPSADEMLPPPPAPNISPDGLMPPGSADPAFANGLPGLNGLLGLDGTSAPAQMNTSGGLGGAPISTGGVDGMAMGANPAGVSGGSGVAPMDIANGPSANPMDATLSGAMPMGTALADTTLPGTTPANVAPVDATQVGATPAPAPDPNAFRIPGM